MILETEDDDRAIAQAGQAQLELEFTEAAFAQLRQVALDEIVRTAPEQQRRLDRLICTVQILDAVKKALIQTVENGRYAAAAQALAESGVTRRD